MGHLLGSALVDTDHGGRRLSRVLGAARAVLSRLGLLPYARRVKNHIARYSRYIPGAQRAAYRCMVAIEQANYAAVETVHDLPAIYHYWSNKYLLPKVRAFGFSAGDDFYANQLELSLVPGKTSRFISIGAGNCDMEARVAGMLRSRGRSDFVIECLDINPAMLQRGKAHAEQRGVAQQMALIEGDFNDWKPRGAYDAVLAHHSLHHVLKLEHLFKSVAAAIGSNGRFISSDMIGRNGHLRWPEALEIVREFWSTLPAQYRYNRQLKRQEDVFLDWDCSVGGFEGVRAQDVLPLLVARFHFELFLPFGNVIDPFIDRSFGPNFDASSEWDRSFIDRVQARDEEALSSGRIKPTHMFAVMRNPGPWQSRFPGGLSPVKCLRMP